MIKEARFLYEDRIYLSIIYSDGHPPMEVFQKLASRGIISEGSLWHSSPRFYSDGTMVKEVFFAFPDGESGPLKKREYYELRRHATSCLRESGYLKKLNSLKLFNNPEPVETPVRMTPRTVTMNVTLNRSALGEVTFPIPPVARQSRRG